MVEVKGNFNRNLVNATKWSTISEIVAKLVVPISNMVLARLISPEAFGVVATVTMIMSFADMLTDAGFQKYLIQHEFEEGDSEKFKYAHVAFWTNFGISAILWLFILVFREKLAILVGNPGLGNVIAIACLQLFLTSFSSIQIALYRREFNFKTLFYVRLVAILIPFVVTIPLAFLGFSYWSIIIGSLVTQLSNAIILTVKSKWKPKLYYSYIRLKKMLSFSIWSLIEALSIWFTVWVDVFIVSIYFNQYYLGVYKTSTIMVNTLMALVASSVVPVLFSALSRLQYDKEKFENLYFTVQRLVSIIVFPIGLGMYLFSDMATNLLLGSQWKEASDVIGIWALTSAIMVVFSYFCSEVYRAKGLPKLSFLAQVLHLVVLVPVCIISSKYSFETFVSVRSWIRMESVLVHLVFMKYVMKIDVSKSFINIIPSFISATLMGIVGYLLLLISNNIVWGIMVVLICSIIYFIFLFFFPSGKSDLMRIIAHIVPGRFLFKF